MNRPRFRARASRPLVLLMALLSHGIAYADSSKGRPAWEYVPSPRINSPDNILYDAAALAPDDVWAVGQRGAPHGYLSLIEHWDGSAWSVSPAPHTGFSDGLKGIAAVSPTDIWAVGFFQQESVFTAQTLTLHWDGTSWTMVPSVHQGGISSSFNAVVAVSADDVWAVGQWYDLDRDANLTLTEHWDGTAWTVSSSPDTGDFDNFLLGVDATSASDAWSVGNWSDGVDIHTLTLHWDGAAWTVVPSPTKGSNDSDLRAVNTLAPDDVWAAGFAGTGPNTSRTLVLRWDGTEWTEVPTPDLGDVGALEGVAALSPDDIWVVGELQRAIGQTDVESLTEHWDGVRWVRARSPSRPVATDLWGVAALSAMDAWAVGGTLSEDGYIRTVTLHSAGDGGG